MYPIERLNTEIRNDDELSFVIQNKHFNDLEIDIDFSSAFDPETEKKMYVLNNTIWTAAEEIIINEVIYNRGYEKDMLETIGWSTFSHEYKIELVSVAYSWIFSHRSLYGFGSNFKWHDKDTEMLVKEFDDYFTEEK